EGDAPLVDLKAERAAGEFVRAAHAAGQITAAHDLSDGGLAVAAAEMALAGDVGVTVTEGDTGWFFGEDQARYLLATRDADALIAAAKKANILAQTIGTFEGNTVVLGDRPITLNKIRQAHETALPTITT
ncbi:MAG: phosphoribosylformylglycinamidine synthase II, partial [Alphaproteobacteria bacterium]|nr:phosphoribosylformylglycinamidine synthase II [Alphaproteobacteria bacterium]